MWEEFDYVKWCWLVLWSTSDSLNGERSHDLHNIPLSLTNKYSSILFNLSLKSNYCLYWTTCTISNESTGLHSAGQTDKNSGLLTPFSIHIWDENKHQLEENSQKLFLFSSRHFYWENENGKITETIKHLFWLFSEGSFLNFLNSIFYLRCS